jgi:signal transduction histidine kinase
VFTATRLRLTGWYLLILAVIIGGLSAVVYHLVLAAQHAELNGVGVRVRESVADIFAHDEVSLLYQIMAIDIGLLAVAAAGSYFLAGRSLRPIEDAMASQRRFATTASHELRTPLTALQGNLEVALLSPRTGEQYREVIRQAVDDSAEMGKMVKGLLTLGRDQYEPGVAQLTLVDTSQAVNCAVKEVRPNLERKQQRIEVNLTPDLQIQGYATQIHEVLTNLLDNAIVYTPDGGSIRIATLREGSTAVVMIEDSGVGIARKHLPHLKEPFYRADRHVGDRIHVGLGLALAQAIVNRHNGKMNIMSHPGVGTTVRLAFPLARRAGFLERTVHGRSLRGRLQV